MRKPREEKFITIKDVAKEANVSIATVSRVMNSGRVREMKKKAVLDAIKKLNYVPNNSARNLASVNATKRIKLLIPSMSVPCYIELVKGFKMGSQLYRYDPVIDEYNNNILQYEKMNMESYATSEIKGIVQIGHYQEVLNKIVVNLDDELLTIIPSSKYDKKKIGIYFPGDEFLTHYFTDNIFKNNDTKDISNNIESGMDMYLTQTIEQAAKLMNEGIMKPIYTLEKTVEVEKLVSNIHTFPVDFYAMGIALSRIVIKKISGKLKEDDEALVLTIE